MRRVFTSAIIGGLVGFAVLLNVAMLKAGCWRNTACDFWNMMLLPSTHFHVQELLVNGQMLLFKKELLESSFDYFVRGAGLGVFSLLLSEAAISWSRKHESSIPPWMVALSVQLSKHSPLFVILAWSIPLLVSLMGFLYLLADGYLYPTTVAILVPSLVLIALVLAAALKKRLFLWQERCPPSSDRAQELTAKESCPQRALLIALQFAVYAMCPILACYTLHICSQHLHWEGLVHDQNSQFSDPSNDLVRGLLLVETINILVSALSISVLVYFIEVILYKVFAREKSLNIALFSGPLFNASLMCWTLIWLLPALHLVVFPPYLVGISHRAIAMNVFRVCVALSTIPSSTLALAVAFGRVRKPARASSLSSETVSS